MIGFDEFLFLSSRRQNATAPLNSQYAFVLITNVDENCEEQTSMTNRQCIRRLYELNNALNRSSSSLAN